MKNVYKNIARYQYLFFPIIVLVAYLLLIKLEILTDTSFESKVEGVVSLSGAFIGVLLTIFTLYTSISKNNEVMQRVINTGHHRIFKKSILFGCTFFMVSILLWLFGFSPKWVVLLMLMGLADIIIATRYISLINDYM